MLETILMQWKDLPIYLRHLYEEHIIFICIVAVVYLFALFFTNGFATFLRWLYVIAAIAFGVYAYFKQNWCLFWIVVFSLVLMIIVKLIVTIVRSIKQRRRDRKIEKRALEKAAKRRGSWEGKQGYSGTIRPVHKPEAKSAKKAETASDEEPDPGILPEIYVTQNTLTDLIDDAPKDPKAEIEATKNELTTAAATARIDTEAIEQALAELEKEKAQ